MKPPASNTRVLMLLENTPYSRDARVPNMAKTLVSAGCRVSVICPGEPAGTKGNLQEGVRLYCFPPPPDGQGFLSYVLEYGYAMAAIFVLSLIVLWREGFDVIHVHCPPDTFAFIAAFYKILGKRFVYDHHDLAPELYCARFGGKVNRLVYRALLAQENLCCRLADHVIATNQSYKTVEMERGGVPEDRISVVRNGPDLNRLSPARPKAHLCPKDKICICYVGRMGVQDGVDHLLRALHHLVYDLGRTSFLCVLVGTGEAVPSLTSLAEQLELGDYVSFAGWVEPDQVASYIGPAHICVAPEPSNPYNDRSTAIKVMEYMAMCKPVVAFDLPENRFTAQDAAAYARPNDTLDFARKIGELMDSPEQRFNIGWKGRHRVDSELAWPYQAQLLLEAYETMLREDNGLGRKEHNESSD